jgi:hypothetical protein
MDTDKKVISQREHPLTKNQVLKTACNSLFSQPNSCESVSIRGFNSWRQIHRRGLKMTDGVPA